MKFFPCLLKYWFFFCSLFIVYDSYLGRLTYYLSIFRFNELKMTSHVNTIACINFTYIIFSFFSLINTVFLTKGIITLQKLHANPFSFDCSMRMRVVKILSLKPKYIEISKFYFLFSVWQDKTDECNVWFYTFLPF